MNLFQTLLVHFNWSLCFPLFLHLLILSVTSGFFSFQKSLVVKGTSFCAVESELIISFKGLIALSLSVSVFQLACFADLVTITAVPVLVPPNTFLWIFVSLCSAFCPSLKLLNFHYHV